MSAVQAAQTASRASIDRAHNISSPKREHDAKKSKQCELTLDAMQSEHANDRANKDE